jgi:hypothetical protein
VSQGPLFLFRIRLGSITLHVNLKDKTKIVLNNLYSRFVLLCSNFVAHWRNCEVRMQLTR